uniref:Uncharacterized protein n=1 Tax=Macrostomum lignano TaxID=282301 RepID=A0A1I8F971_9PLAT
MRAKSYWQTQKQSCSKGRVALIVALCLMVGGTIFLIIGFFVSPMRQRRRRWRRRGLCPPHVATQATDPAKDYVKSHWTKTFQAHKDRVADGQPGLSSSTLKGEAGRRENSIRNSIRANNSRVDFTSQTVEKPLTEHDNDTDIPSPILAYAPSDTVARAAAPRRSPAAKYGAAGVLIFSDPADVAKTRAPPSRTASGCRARERQKGLRHAVIGDPTTPGYPSLRPPIDTTTPVARGSLPAAANVSDAREIIDRLEGAQAPEDWRVRIRGMNLSRPMRLGPKMSGDHNWRLWWVIVGNEHRDGLGLRSCWTRPSGTAVADGVQRVPRRTWLAMMEGRGRSIMLCNWGSGREHGLHRHWEFVEENLMMLKMLVLLSISLK